MNKHIQLSTTMALFMFLLVACTPSAVPEASQVSAQADTAPAASAASSTSDHGADHMTTDPASPFDAQFIDSMIVHHEGALAMANVALAEAEHEELRTLADAIIGAQADEIAQMQAWRTAWYPDLAATSGMDMEMAAMAVADDSSIAFDQRFLEAMILHHRDAISMAEAARTQAEHDEIRELADAIIAAQQSEITQMQQWLQEWYDVQPD